MNQPPAEASPPPARNADYAGARRGRRAFRYAVLAVAALTFGLWFSEGYLRYDRAETQYRMSLTLPPASARPILRNIVKRETEKTGAPTPKYIEALAAVEESDKLLDAYEQAYKLNPNNSFLIINYGCRLYRDHQYAAARERFHEAAVRPPRNALPAFLEAAAMAASTKDDNDLSDIFSLIAQANSSEYPILFPQPLWHPSLPTDGAYYEKLRRELVDQSCAPLYDMKVTLLARARSHIEKREIRDWDTWLEKLQTMGQRLVGSAHTDPASVGVDQALAGVQIQLDAISWRQQIAQTVQGKSDSALIERAVKLNNASATLKKFENQREPEIQAHSMWLAAPLRMAFDGAAIIMLVFLLAYALVKQVRPPEIAWTIAHLKSVWYFLPAATTLLFAMLLLCIVFDHASLYLPSALLPVNVGWYGVIGAALLFGLLYPFLFPRDLSAGAASPLHNSFKVRVVLMRRYFGLLTGTFICLLCAWVLTFRMVESIYPMQQELLIKGLGDEDLAVVGTVQDLLQ